MLVTRDLGHFDERGLLYIDGREDDVIVSGGEKVLPGEVEDLLSQHPEVLEVAVIGVSDAEFGQRLKAFVVPRPGACPLEADLKTYVRERLARYKVPREVELVEELPRTDTGKILRRVLASG
jgi:fatty-acyl-CoA synthase